MQSSKLSKWSNCLQHHLSYPFGDNLCSAFSCKGLRTFQAHTKYDESSWLCTIQNSKLHVPSCSSEMVRILLIQYFFFSIIQIQLISTRKTLKIGIFFKFHAGRINNLVRLWGSRKVRVDWRYKEVFFLICWWTIRKEKLAQERHHLPCKLSTFPQRPVL